MDDLYVYIRDDIIAAWNAGWTRSDVPVLWRGDDPIPSVDPLNNPNGPPGNGDGTLHFFRNEIDPGPVELIGFGSGRKHNLFAQSGSLVLRIFSSITVGDETEALRLMGIATGMFRSFRTADAHGGDLSFIGTGSSFDQGPTENGLWFMRARIVVFEYRFTG